MKTVKELRQAGFTVKVRHNRNIVIETYIMNFIKRDKVKVLTKGGFTEVSIYDDSESIVGSGVAKCSNKDNYNRKLGVKIALGRAIKQAGVRLSLTDMRMDFKKEISNM